MNPYEGDYKKVLFVCSAGLLRSPTAAVVAHHQFGWNTRSCGAYKEYALIPVSSLLCYWADDIYCMEKEHAEIIHKLFKPMHLEYKTFVLNIPDKFPYMDVKLQELIVEKLSNADVRL